MSIVQQLKVDMEAEGKQCLRYQVCCPDLPLSVYRELAAHLQQVNGVEVGLIPQGPDLFNYHRSQVGGVWFQISESSDTSGSFPSFSKKQVDRILAYYQERYGLGKASEI